MIRSPSLSSTYAWRRLHGGDLIAEVVSVRGMGMWRVQAYRVDDKDRDVTTVSRTYSLLTEAHAAADDLVRSAFAHTCKAGVCGRWLRWTENPSV